MSKRKPPRLVTEVTHHEPSTEVSAAGELHTVHRADLRVTDRTSGQSVCVRGVLDVQAILASNPT